MTKKKEKNMCKIAELEKYGLTRWETTQLEKRCGFNSVEEIMDLYEYSKGEDEKLILSIPRFGRKRYDKVICAVIDCLASHEEDRYIEPKKDFPEKDDGTVDIKAVSNNIVSKQDIADIIINTAMDLAEQNEVTSLNKAYDKANPVSTTIFVSQKRIYIEKQLLEKEFNKRVKNLYMDTGEARKNFFDIALNSSTAVQKKFSSKLGKEFTYTRKSFSPNSENYVEIDIVDAENQVNRIFDNPYEATDYNYIEQNTETNNSGIFIVSKPLVKHPEPFPVERKSVPVVVEERKNQIPVVEVEAPKMEAKPESDNSDIILIPVSFTSSKFADGRCFRFKLYKVDDKYDFDLNAEKAYSGEYTYQVNDVENGELMISGYFDYYELIKMKVVELCNR